MRRDQIRAVVLAVFAAALMITIGWLQSRGNTITVLNLIREDGPFESLGALASLAAGTTFLYLAIAFRSSDVIPADTSWTRWWYVALGIGLLAMFVEEISWGQRAIGFATPEWLEGENRQQEFNLHNLFLFNPRYDLNWLKLLWVLASVAFLGLASIAAAIFSPIRHAFQKLGMPVACWPIGIVILVASWWYFYETDQARQWGNHLAGHAVGETLEVIIEVLFLALAIQCLDSTVSSRRRWRTSMVVTMVPAILLVGTSYFRSEAVPREVQAEAELQQGIALLSQGKLDQALDHLERSIEIVPDNPRAEFHCGLIYHSSDDFDAAITYFSSAVLHDPQMTVARYNLGLAYLSNKMYQMAQTEFLRILAEHPEDADTHYYLALTLNGLGNHERAKQHLQEALRIRPDFEQAKQELQAIEVPPN